jgi:hypothetical protein
LRNILLFCQQKNWEDFGKISQIFNVTKLKENHDHIISCNVRMLNAKENSLYQLINATVLMPNMKTLIPIQVDNIYIYESNEVYWMHS